VENGAVGVGVAGLGAIGRVHAANLAAVQPGARLVMVADTSAAAREQARHLFDVRSSESFLDLLDQPEVDAVVIATPPSTHADMVELAAAAGKHVFCEKPLALGIDDAERALAAVTRAGVILQIGFHRRFDRDFMLAKSRIARGELGEIYTFFDSMRDLEPPPQGAIGGPEQALLHDAACHDLDAARWLVGEIEEITTFGATLASESLREIGQVDHAITVMRFENGALGSIDNTLASGYGFDCRCEIVGSKAAVRIDNPYLTNIESLTKGWSGHQRTRTFLDRFRDAYPRELAAFAEAVRQGTEVAATGDEGRAAVVLATAAQRSLETGTTVRLRREVGQGRLRYAIDRPVA
jgi:myo-inositol 2-dehydrogenase/D-chiro-inositol 1-dehydrogenase